MPKLRHILLVLTLMMPMPAIAQSRAQEVEIKNADLFTSQKTNGREIRKLKGNVVMKQEEVMMYCDSAYHYPATNSIEAFSNVRINQADTVNLYGDRLDYDGNRKYAVVRGNVRLMDRQMTLTTNRLDYDMRTRTGFYLDGGTIRDGENTLTSQRGYYYANARTMNFRQQVKLVNPDMVMLADTLVYHMPTKTAFMYGPTTIQSENDFLYTEDGRYNTGTQEAWFGKESYLLSDGQYLFGDSLYYNRNTAVGQARHNVRIIDSAEDLTIFGHYGIYYQKDRRTYIADSALLRRAGTDTFYLTADTLLAIHDSATDSRILYAYQQGTMFNREFQAKADTLVYSLADSIIHMRVNPVLWMRDYQITADRMKILTGKNEVRHATLTGNAFIVLEEDTGRYSQIKGRNLEAYFVENEISEVEISGNGESVYYVRDDNKDYIGVNYIASSDINIRFQDRAITRINFKQDPSGKMNPLQKVSKQDVILKGFKWRGDERPADPERLVTKH